MKRYLRLFDPSACIAEVYEAADLKQVNGTSVGKYNMNFVHGGMKGLFLSCTTLPL